MGRQTAAALGTALGANLGFGISGVHLVLVAVAGVVAATIVGAA